MKLLNKVIRGLGSKKSRFHDAKGNFATWKNVILHGGPAIASTVMRVTLGYRPKQPWIAYTSTLAIFLPGRTLENQKLAGSQRNTRGLAMPPLRPRPTSNFLPSRFFRQLADAVAGENGQSRVTRRSIISSGF